MGKLQCPRCSTIITVVPGENPSCPTCGFTSKKKRGTGDLPENAGSEPPDQQALKAQVDQLRSQLESLRSQKGTTAAPTDSASLATLEPASAPGRQATNDVVFQEIYHPPAPQQVHFHQHQSALKAPSMGVAIVALLLNALLWPGLGSLVGGDQVGWAQGFLFLLGVLLLMIFIGIFIVIPVWIWGIVTGVQLINRSSEASRYR
jgi:hypothetical protein